jgi:GMP synthase (glutamine-hydrolysing)
VEEPQIGWHDVESADVVLIGGAGSHSATVDYEFTGPLTEVALRWIEAGRPLFGSCWGHHFLARALGGRVVEDLEREEVGTFDIQLTEAGRADPIFRDVPHSFTAQLGHHDRVFARPAGFEELAYSSRCRNQVLRMSGKPVYGTQFHCELDEVRIRERLAMYQEEYVDPGRTIAQIPVAASPHPPRLLRRFLELYVGTGGVAARRPAS